MPWGTARSNAASAVCSRGGGACTGACGRAGQVEPCQCVSSQPWACHGALQGQTQPLQCAAVVRCLALGAAAGPSRWFMGVAVLPLGGDFCRGGGSTRQPQRTEPCQCVGGQPWACHGALQDQMQPLQCEVGMEGPALRAAAGPSGLFSGVAFWPVHGDFQRRRQHPATTAHRALPVCGCPALGMTWGTARSNAAFDVCSRCGGACTGGCSRAGQVVCWACGFVGLWRFPEEEAALGYNSAQSPASVRVASPGHAVGHCKVKCSLCSVQQGWRGLCWGLRQGWAGGLWELRFCRFVEISRGGVIITRQPQRTEPCQCVGGQPWACHGAL